ncbi:glycosyltransferase [Bacteroidota bacterium]
MPPPTVSVIICAKNEEENLRKHISAFLNQDYPEFEVIVVDDQSEDDTNDFLHEIAEKNSLLKVVTVSAHIRDHLGKKLALTLGIRKSVNEILLLSDADCAPVSNQWIRQMVSNYSTGKQIVLGFSPYSWKNSLLNVFIQIDTFFTALQYFSFSLAGMTYMGVGRNLSYRKELFYTTGFASHLHVPFGDDDLFVNENATKNNVAIEISPDSFVTSVPHTRFKYWFRQKKRHLKGGIEYKKEHKFWLGALWVSYFVFFALFAAAIIREPYSLYVWGVFAFRFVVSFLIYTLIAVKLRMIKLLWFLPVFEVMHLLLFMPVLSFISSFSNKKYW